MYVRGSINAKIANLPYTLAILHRVIYLRTRWHLIIGTMYATYGYNDILRTRSRAFDATLYAGHGALLKGNASVVPMTEAFVVIRYLSGR